MFRKGQWVMVDGRIAIVVVPGPGVERNMGQPVQEIRAGYCLVHFVNEDGTTVMLPDVERQKFVTAAFIVPNEQITPATTEQIPESRR